jgi:hypothetical protein
MPQLPIFYLLSSSFINTPCIKVWVPKAVGGGRALDKAYQRLNWDEYSECQLDRHSGTLALIVYTPLDNIRSHRHPQS